MAIVSNLPPQVTPFIGRAAEIAEIGALLADPACSLLTLTGPGGIGKTRLALEVGAQAEVRTRQFPDGVYFVPLQPLTSADLILSAIADALKVQFSSGSAPEEQLSRYLRSKTLLLLLDNFDHLLDGVSLISRLLAHAQQVKALVTSREALNLREEWLYALHGMIYPPHLEDHNNHIDDAVSLFTVTARRLNPKFSVEGEVQQIARICRLVEGTPLALEMAASWVRALTCAEIAAEIERGLDILESRASNVPARHQKFHSVLDQSWSKLTKTEQTVFAKLSVFCGGFTRHAAGEVAAASLSTLASLVNKSWLRHQPNGRYDIHELLRQYGAQRLGESPEQAAITPELHCSYYANFLAYQWQQARAGHMIKVNYEVESDLENVRVYWDWAIQHQLIASIEMAVNILWYFYDTGVRFHEGEQCFARAAAMLRTKAPVDAHTRLVLGKVLARQGSLNFSLDHPNEAIRLLQESLEILRDSDAHEDLAMCLIYRGICANLFESQPQTAREHFQAAITLCEAHEDQWWQSHALLWLGHYHLWMADNRTAYALYERSLALSRTSGNVYITACSSSQLSFILQGQGQVVAALRYGREALRLFTELGTAWGQGMTNYLMGLTAVEAGDIVQARQHALNGLTIVWKYQLQDHIRLMLLLIAKLWEKQGDLEGAAESLGLYRQRKGLLQNISDRIVENLLNQLQERLPADTIAAALQRGEAMDYYVYIPQVTARLQQQEEVYVAAQDTYLLTEREFEVLRLVADGRSNREIAEQLVLALGTVKWYVSSIFSKLGVASRTQATARIRDMNLLSPKK